jgi:glucose-6-phosphate 1-dehydrogenase
MSINKKLTFVVFGITGDLAKLKLIPAIYMLLKQNPDLSICLIGVARSPVSIESILDEAKGNLSTQAGIKDLDEKIWQRLYNNASYQTLDLTNFADFEKLKNKVMEIESQNKLSGDRLFYLATLPEYFESTTENLAKVGLVNVKDKKWERVIYEKPFGKDLKTARQINKKINQVFLEENVYRIDHYLGKELVGNIALLRFTNRILEPLWNNKHIESVQIISSENFGIKNRGNYFDKYGTIKDILQNHLLQMTALLAIEPPKFLAGEYLRDEKVKVLKKIKIKDILLGQYDGYLSEKGVGEDSKTETFFTAKLVIDTKRWRGTPFFIKAGKNLAKKETVIHIKFKPVKCLLAKTCPTDSNYLTIRVEPNEGFAFEINSKTVRKGFEITPINMEYCHHCEHGFNTLEAYEVILEQAILGEQSFFVRNDEVELAWKIVDSAEKITKGKDGVKKVYKYPVGSVGPKELDAWSLKNKINWKP